MSPFEATFSNGRHRLWYLDAKNNKIKKETAAGRERRLERRRSRPASSQLRTSFDADGAAITGRPAADPFGDAHPRWHLSLASRPIEDGQPNDQGHTNGSHDADPVIGMHPTGVAPLLNRAGDSFPLHQEQRVSRPERPSPLVGKSSRQMRQTQPPVPGTPQPLGTKWCG